MKQTSTLIGAAVAAIAASSCCILPALLGVASAGTLGFSAALSPYRPYFIGLTVLLLGTAFYFTYRSSKAACDVDGQCATERTASAGKFGKAVLWGVTALTIGAMLYPSLALSRAQSKAASNPLAQLVGAPAATTKTALFAIGNMTCAECSLQIVDVLKKTPGVQEAKVNFEAKQATIRYDAGRVNVTKLRAVIEGVGYPTTNIR